MNHMRTIAFVSAAAIVLSSLAGHVVPALGATSLGGPPSAPGEGVGEEVWRFLVPAGSRLEGRASPGGFAFAVVPSPGFQGEKMGHLLWVADCHNDVVTHGYGVGHRASVSTNERYLHQMNLASRGECRDETHQGPVSLIRFETNGDSWGTLVVEAEERNSGLVVECVPAAGYVGVGRTDDWAGVLVGDEMECSVRKWGSDPGQYQTWRAWVVNHHVRRGYAWASFS